MARARSAGLRAVLTCGDDIAASEAALRISRAHPDVRVAVGIHPHRAQTCDEASVGRLRELARDPAVVAIGEIGLDASGRSAPQAAQERAFDIQVRLAAELDLPVVVHVRESGPAVRDRLSALPSVRGQVHCYSEGVAEIADWLALGFTLSFAGTLTYERSDRLREAVRALPRDRLLFETDAPYLAPVPHRGRRNEPAFVRETIAVAARERDEDPIALGEQAWRNGLALFGRRLEGAA
jgi:TatD DNase family protein